MKIELRRKKFKTKLNAKRRKQMKESEPDGLSPKEPGAKLDKGKVRAGLAMKDFGRALLGVSGVTTFGANKYSDSGWREVKDGIARYEDAMHRHLLKRGTEELDRDSGLPHLLHAAWNILAVIELQMKGGHVR
jgi:hypothetical protein